MTHTLVFPMQRGPFQNNGASPWYVTLMLGTPGQHLKLAIDTGTNIAWATSSLCPEDQCEHYSASRFDYQASSTFFFTDCLQRPYSFGPWGTMQVECGTDVLSVPQDTPLPIQLFLAAHYAGDQFKQLDWDGGIGMPSSSAYVASRSSFLLQDLLQAGRINPEHPFVAFDWNAKDKTGTCEMGGIDESKTQGPSLFLPWSVYNKRAGVEYMWSADLKSYSVGGEALAHNIKFALDSGSSQFKGDDNLMRQTLERIAQGGKPKIVLGFADGEITLSADLYSILIEQGPQKGKRLPQFEPLGLPELVLVGSLVMDHCYTVHEYQVMHFNASSYALAPVGIWLFNRPDGPQIITRSSTCSFKPGPRPVSRKKMILPAPTPAQPSVTPARVLTSCAGRWVNAYGSVMELSVHGAQVSGTYQSSTGSTGTYEVTGYQLSASSLADPDQTEKGLPLALAIDWHSISAGPADPSWHWTSGLCGQINVVDNQEVLTLSHLLEATRDFAHLAERGTYLDKLTYQRAHALKASSPEVGKHNEYNIDNPLQGRWITEDGDTLQLQVRTCSDHRLGRVQGCFWSANRRMDVSGFTDINATQTGLTLQSVSLSGADKEVSEVTCLSGSLDLVKGELSLMRLTGCSTTAANRYLQTRVVALHFKR